MSATNGKISLLPDERIVMSSNNDSLVLTNYRIRYDSTEFGTSIFVGITLDSLASCGLLTKSTPVLLLLAGLAVIAAFVANNNFLLFVIAIGLGIAYFLLRRAVISIDSNGGQSIVVPTKGMNRTAIIAFLEAIEHEKLSRKT
jgi:hypothetical protein